MKVLFKNSIFDQRLLSLRFESLIIRKHLKSVESIVGVVSRVGIPSIGDHSIRGVDIVNVGPRIGESIVGVGKSGIGVRISLAIVVRILSFSLRFSFSHETPESDVIK